MVAQPPIKPSPQAEEASSVRQSTGVWSPSSWRTKEAKQMPKYNDPAVVEEVEDILSKQAPLVFAGEV